MTISKPLISGTLQHAPSPKAVALLVKHRIERQEQTGSHRNHSWMLPCTVREALMESLCAEYGLPMPMFFYCRNHFEFKSRGRSIDYVRGTVYSVRTPIFGKHILWAFYWHFMWVHYQLEPDSVPLEHDQQEPGEVFAHCYWREMHQRVRE
jgi:hypothetical protein